MQRVTTFVTNLWEATTESQIWKSIFRHGAPTSNRNRVLVVMSNVFLHLHPVKSRKAGRHVYYTLDDEHVYAIFGQGLDHVLHG